MVCKRPKGQWSVNLVVRARNMYVARGYINNSSYVRSDWSLREFPRVDPIVT